MPPDSTAPSGLRDLAIPAVCFLVLFLGYFSQYLFNTTTLPPGPLTRSELLVLNASLVCLWYTYYKACTVSPGYFCFPPSPCDQDKRLSTAANTHIRWCRECAAPRPPRAHHCRVCRTCIPRMDHHCPWTANCVGLQNFPHFLRFLLYTNMSLVLLAYHLWQRLYASIWEARDLPAYLGPTLGQLSGLAALTLVSAVTVFILFVMLVTSVRSWVLNMSMIEEREASRHEATVERLRRGGSYGLVHEVDFPYDVGFFANMAYAMGTRNVLDWLVPWGGGPKLAAYETVVKALRERKGNEDEHYGLFNRTAGWYWPENGYNVRRNMWPPADPDIEKLGKWPSAKAEAGAATTISLTLDRAEFAKRQEVDVRRRIGGGRPQEGEGLDLGHRVRPSIISVTPNTAPPASQNILDRLEEGIDHPYDPNDPDFVLFGRGHVHPTSVDAEHFHQSPKNVYSHSRCPSAPSSVASFEDDAKLWGLDDGDLSWTDPDGVHLYDYGVVEKAEEYQKDLPVAELIRRRKETQARGHMGESLWGVPMGRYLS